MIVIKPPLGGLATAVAWRLKFVLVTRANLNWPVPLKFVPFAVTRPWYVNTVFWA